MACVGIAMTEAKTMTLTRGTEAESKGAMLRQLKAIKTNGGR